MALSELSRPWCMGCSGPPLCYTAIMRPGPPDRRLTRAAPRGTGVPERRQPSPAGQVRTTAGVRVMRPRYGFTLLELVVVLIVLALIATLVAPQIFGRASEARGITAQTQMQLLATALDNYRLDTGSYPTTEQGLQALRERPTRSPVPSNWRGPYLRKDVPLDPWGRPYLYTSPGTRNATAFDLSTLGRDGKPGGSGEDADLTGQ